MSDYDVIRVSCADQGSRSGSAPDVARPLRPQARHMPRFLIEHHHEPRECGVVFAAFRGHRSRLRHRPALASCTFGDHTIWWSVEAEGEAEALALLPVYVAERAVATRVDEVHIP